MIETFLITGRETLEASLVIGVVLAYLNKTGNPQYKKTVYYGVIFGILASILSAIGFTLFAGGFEGRLEQIFEGATMLIGAFLLSTMIMWMLKQRHISSAIKSKVESHLNKEQPLFSHIGIFALVFIAILREGVETVIFLNALNYSSGISFISGTLGIAAAVFIGYLVLVSSRKLNLRKLFNYSSILLILFAAGLVAHGVHEFEEAGVLNPIIYPLYDINPAVNFDGSYPALHEKGMIGSFAKGLFGYNGNPSLLEVMSYFFYLGVIYLLFRRIESSKVKV